MNMYYYSSHNAIVFILTIPYSSNASSCSPDISVDVESAPEGDSTKVSIFVDGELVITSTNAVKLTTLLLFPVYIIQNGETFYVFGELTGTPSEYTLAYIAQCNCFYINSTIL
jgi:hypothetical protein